MFIPLNLSYNLDTTYAILIFLYALSTAVSTETNFCQNEGKVTCWQTLSNLT